MASMSISNPPKIESSPMAHDSFAPIESASIDANRLPWLANEYLSSLRGKIAEQSREKYEQRIRHFLR